MLGGRGWGQVQALPGFHARVRPRPEKGPLGPSTLQARVRNEGRLVISFVDGCLGLEGSTERCPTDPEGKCFRAMLTPHSTQAYTTPTPPGGNGGLPQTH